MSVGHSIPRKDVFEKVTGEARFIDDYSFPDMLYGKIVMAGVPHAALEKISIPQINQGEYFLTAQDIPGENQIGIMHRDQPLLAEEVIRYRHEPVALIAAESSQRLKAIEQGVNLHYKELKALFSYEDALNEKAPFLHKNGNVPIQFCLRKGDALTNFSECAFTVEKFFSTPYQEHLYLEPQGVIAIKKDQEMYIYGSLQCPFYVRKAVAAVLGIPMASVRVIQTTMGGGFGGKEDVPNETCSAAALLALKSGRPVKIVYDRTEDIQRTSKRHRMYMKYRFGCDREGRLLAAKADIFADIGAYATLSPAVIFRSFAHALGPYVISHAHVDIKGVYTNNQPAGAFRGFGTPQVVVAHESMMDELALKAGFDPLEFRRLNILRYGQETVHGQKLTESVGLEKCLNAIEPYYRKMKDLAEGNNRENTGSYLGVGLSSIYYGNGLGVVGKAIDAAGSLVQVNYDGSVYISNGCVDMGQGAITVLSQITAEGLGFPVEAIYPNFSVDTGMVQDSGPTVASRTTVMCGNALLDSCKKIKNRLLTVACKLLNQESGAGYQVEDLDLINGLLYHQGQKVDGINHEKITQACLPEHIQLTESGWYKVPETNIDIDSGLGSTYYVFCFAAQVVLTEIDKVTGEVTVKKVVSAHDLGKSVNPQMSEAQIYGGVVQGMGYALYEDLISVDGEFLNPTMTDYIVPSIRDIPEIVPILIEEPSRDGPYGVKGIGEPALIPIAGSIPNAVAYALKERICDLPLLPEKIKERLLIQENAE